MAGPFEHDGRSAELRGEVECALRLGEGVGRAVDDEHRAADARAESHVVSGSISFVSQPRKPARIVSASVSRPQPTQSSIGFVECGSVKHSEKKCSR